MKLQFDTARPYALALEGGGAKGAYQIGAWRALKEAGITVNAVSGTSVGALNGALIAMGDLKKAEEIWKNIRYSQVMNVDDEVMRSLMEGDLRKLNLHDAAEVFADALKNRGFDVTPLFTWMQEQVDEALIRASETELYIVTFSLSDKRVLELRASDLPEGKICEMLLASAYLPVFRNERLSGKRYTDGGIADALPLHALIDNGYQDIIAVRLYGYGLQRPVRIPSGTRVHMILPSIDLGNLLDFRPEQSQRYLTAGYFDTQRLLYGLKGKHWYIDAVLSEDVALGVILHHLQAFYRAAGKTPSLRCIHEQLLPALARRLDARKGDYRDLLIALLESAAGEAALDRWQIYTESRMIQKLPEFFPAPEVRDVLLNHRSLKN